MSLKEQRIGVFVDVQNLYYSAKNLYNSKVNFANVLKKVVDERKLIRAIAYVIRTEAMTEKSFFEALEKMGFEIMAKDLQIFYGGAKKGDWDVGISMDIIESAPKLDVVILVSGDGDFVPALQHARSSGCIVEAAAFGRSASSKLKEAVTTFTDLDKQKERYLIKGRGMRRPVSHSIRRPISSNIRRPISPRPVTPRPVTPRPTTPRPVTPRPTSPPRPARKTTAPPKL